jgi:hypothetical protein
MQHILVILAFSLTVAAQGCSRANYIRSAYIAPDGSCGYVVMLGDPIDGDPDPQLSRCLPIDEARKLADKINIDMDGKWSGAKP